MKKILFKSKNNKYKNTIFSNIYSKKQSSDEMLIKNGIGMSFANTLNVVRNYI